MKNSENHLDSCSGRLAEYLQSHKEAFIAEWLAQVCKDSGVASDSLTKPEIIDHVPVIFDAIIQALREHGSESTLKQVKNIAARHTIIRWVQGYNLRAVLREVSLLRAQFIPHLRTFEEEQKCFGSDAHLFTSTTIHRILDGVIMDATVTFLKVKNHADGDEA